MIESGGSFLFRGRNYVIGAVFVLKGRRYIAASSHIFQEAGSRVKAGGVEGIVKRFLEDYDIALIELPPDCISEATVFGRAEVMEDALLVNERHSIPGRVTRSGTSLLSLQFPCSDMPQPGDSGSPILQEGMVVGLLSSVMLGNCTGTAVSSDVLRSLSDL